MFTNPHLIRADGSVDSGAPAQSPKAQSAFRYYRFANSSEDLFEAYRYIYLCLESALDDLDPKSKLVQKRKGMKKRTEREWLIDALGYAKSKYSLDLSAFSANPLDAVDQFIQTHYVLIRCATFHAKSSGSLMPGNLSDVKQVDGQLQKLQPIVKQLIKEHFGTGFPSSGMMPHTLNSQLEILIPRMMLATSPMKVADLGQEVQSALTSSGYYDTLSKRREDVTATTVEEEVAHAIHRAQERFAFDLTPITLEGKRPGYDDEWIVTAEPKADRLRHSEVHSMVLVFMFDEKTLADNVPVLATEKSLISQNRYRRSRPDGHR